MIADLTDEDFERWPNFKRSEFASKDNGECRMEPRFMDLIQALRLEYGKPMVITSGYRSPEHNASVSDTGGSGVHTTGCAADILVCGGDAVLLLRIALRLGFHGVGISQKGDMGKRFIHLDVGDRAKFPRPAMWSY